MMLKMAEKIEDPETKAWAFSYIKERQAEALDIERALNDWMEFDNSSTFP